MNNVHMMLMFMLVCMVLLVALVQAVMIHMAIFVI